MSGSARCGSSDTRGPRSSGAAALVVLAGLMTGSGAFPLPGQELPGRLHVGVAGATFVDYPLPFTDEVCEENVTHVAPMLGFRPVSFLIVEGSVALPFARSSTVCALPALSEAPVAIGQPVTRVTFPDRLREGSDVATLLSLVVEPLPTAPVAPRLRIGAARFWWKEAGGWSAGAGLRFRFGRHSGVVDVEQWTFDLDGSRRVLVYEADGSSTVLSQETITRRERPWRVRLAWEMAVR